MISGRVFDIKRYAVHDGSGIRTTVFLKGCPLHCRWCHNPEGLKADKELGFSKILCIACGKCVNICPQAAVTMENMNYRRNSNCDLCGSCVEVCPTTALTMIGQDMTVAELMKVLKADSVFYETSQGGVTFSGGEVFFQSAFVKAALQACKEAGYHTAVETSLYCQTTEITDLLPLIDLWIVDLKLIDEEKHKQYTGVGNELILSNLRFLAGKEVDILVRIPLIPEITATKENITGISGFLNSLPRNLPVELINYNPLTESKYPWLNKSYDLSACQPLSEAELDNCRSYLEDK